MDHLPCARPTENIFNLLESLRSESSLFRYPTELEFDMLKVITKWLEVSFRECNRLLETPQTNNQISSRDLDPSDRAPCTIASRVNFFMSNKVSEPVNLNRDAVMWTDRLSIITKCFTY